MNQEMKEHVRNSLKKGVRLDGRKLEEIRPLEIQSGFLSTAEGSAKVKCGETEVFAGVKMAVEKPFPDSPEDGVLMVNAEMLPISNPEFEAGPPSIDSIETSRVIDRGIRESKSVDTKKLCIKKGEESWAISIDVSPMNYDGNLIDIGGLAALAALKNARFPKRTEDGIDYHEKTDQKVDIQRQPIPVTVCKVGDQLIVDPTDEEERAVDARLTVTSVDKDHVCAMQKGGDTPLSQKEIDEMIDLALKKSEELRKKLNEVN